MQTYSSLRRRMRFALHLAAQRTRQQSTACPFCGARRATLVGRKFWLMQVRRCESCGLMFRVPQEEAITAADYYQSRYDEFENGLVTKLPEAAQLAELRRTGFAGSPWWAGAHLEILKAVAPERGRLLDYGCSWGYFLYQAQQAGFEVTGFELSQRRAAYARGKLGVTALSTVRELAALAPGTFDAIHCSHVLEHVTDLRSVLEQLIELLRPGGRLVFFVPNCDGDEARQQGVYWGPFANEAHVLSFDQQFFAPALALLGVDAGCSSEPYQLGAGEQLGDPLCRGSELLVVGKKR